MTDALTISIIVIVISVLLLIYQKYWNRAIKCTSENRVDGKIILITGGNSGLGKATATELAKRGGHIILACRDVEKGESAARDVRSASGNPDVDVMQLDVASHGSVQEFAHLYAEKYDRVDVLIHNAAVLGGPYTETEDGVELTLATNHLGPFMLTHLLLDVLQASIPARIILMSSHAHIFAALNVDSPVTPRKSYSSTRIYCDSKLANILFTSELGHRLKDSGISVFAVHPGLVYTNHYKNLNLVRWLPPLAKWLGKTFMKSENEGIQTVIHCAVSDDMEQYSGRYFSNCALATPNVNGLNRNLSRRLWIASCRLTGLPRDLIPADNLIHEAHQEEQDEARDSDMSDEQCESVVEQLQFVGLDEIHNM